MGDRVTFDKCWICEGRFPEPLPVSGGTIPVDCATCGPYQISFSQYVSAFPEGVDRNRLSFWNKQRAYTGAVNFVVGGTLYELGVAGGSLLAALPTGSGSTLRSLSADYLYDNFGPRSIYDADSPSTTCSKQ